MLFRSDKDLPNDHPYFLHVRSHGGKFEAVAPSSKAVVLPGVQTREATLEEIMIALERGNAE